MEKKKWITSTGVGLIAFFIGGWMLFSMVMDTEGSGSGDFSYYAGPVLPMTSLGGAGGLDVERSVDFDFSLYEAETDYNHRSRYAARITDAYGLTNTTAETVETTLVYGFQGRFIDYAEEFPTITVDGQQIQPELRPTTDPDGVLWRAWDFENYKELQAEGDFLSLALEEPVLADIPVTAYHFTDLAYNGGETASCPMLVVTFDLDENTSMWEEGTASIGTLEDSGRCRVMFRVDRGDGWIFTLGGTAENMEFGGNRDYNFYENSAIDGVEYELEVYETDLYSALKEVAEGYDFWEVRTYPDPGLLTPEILLDGALKQIAELGWLEETGKVRNIGDLFYDVVTSHRMMYLLFPVEIAPGQTVRVEASFVQEPSSDHSGPKDYREGYDMATKLGSDLNFTDLSASVSQTQYIDIIRQNFGFDLEKGIDHVNLDPGVERYYMEVVLKE